MGAALQLDPSFDGAMSWISPFLRRAVRLRSDYGREATDHVLGARDREDLLARLEELSCDDRYWESERAPADQVQQQLSPGEMIAKIKAEMPDMDSLTAVLGTDAAARYLEGFEALRVVGLRCVEFQENYPELLAPWMPKPRPQRAKLTHVSDLFYNARIPLIIRKELARGIQALLAVAVIGRAEERGKKLRGWLAMALADTFAAEMERARQHTTLESIGRILVSVIDIAQDVRKARAVVARWQREAEASGKGIYFPLDPAEHADPR